MTFFPSLKQNFIVYHSSKVSSRPDCIFEIHQLWQSGFSRVYSNSCGNCSFEVEIIKIGQSSHKMYSNNLLNIQEYTWRLIILKRKATKLQTYWMHHVYIYIYILREKERERKSERRSGFNCLHLFQAQKLCYLSTEHRLDN